MRWRAWLPHDRSWLAAATQFPGTLFFNATTFWAMAQGLSPGRYDRVVWRPDFFGSVLFLVSSAFAVVALGRFLSWRPRCAGWRRLESGARPWTSQNSHGASSAPPANTTTA